MSVVAVSLKKKASELAEGNVFGAIVEKHQAERVAGVLCANEMGERHGHALGGREAVFVVSSRRRHTSLTCDWSSDVCSSDLRPFPTRSSPPPARASSRRSGASPGR